ncbi:MAG: hypothetical protein HYW52_10750 [Gemmatimonadetes bacterium]|nr:hypothetical protein [Gemmatimonadota bacterium]
MAGVVVRVLGLDTVVVTRSDGAIRLADLPPGDLTLTLHRIGYTPREYALAVPPGRSVSLGHGMLALTPLPVVLEAATVVGRPDQSRMLELAGFYARRQTGFGDYITRGEFERYTPSTVHDVRHVPGVYVPRNPRRGQRRNPSDPSSGVDFREYLVEFRRPGARLPNQAACPVQFFLDGTDLGNDETIMLDDVLAANQIEAVEAYSGVQVPVQFSGAGPECGVLVFWTRR